MSIVVAGELIELNCPQNSYPIAKEGVVITKEFPNFYVVKVDGSKIVLGPLTAGKFDLELKCSNEQTINKEITVQALQTPPDHEAPLNPFSRDYPTWLWIVLAVVIIAPALIAYILKALKNKKNIKKNKKRELTNKEKMLKALKEANGSLFIDSTKHEVIKHKYTELANLFRLCCDQVYKTNTGFYTSSEFVSTLRSIASSKGLNPQRVSQIESILLRADQVRFAKYQATPQERKMFVDDLNEIFNILKLHIDAEERKTKEALAKNANRKP